MAQTHAPRSATVHALTPCTLRAGLPCLVLLLGWVLVVPSWATSAQVPAPAGRFRLWHDVEDILTWTWGGARTAFTMHIKRSRLREAPVA
jgi:hypothetical protein